MARRVHQFRKLGGQKSSSGLSGTSKFALLNGGAAKAAGATYTPVAIVLDAEPDDPSHSLIKGYEAYNDQVAEELAKVIIDTYPAKP